MKRRTPKADPSAKDIPVIVGDVVRLQPTNRLAPASRRLARFFDADSEEKRVDVLYIERRTTTTYRRR
jgi:hypothetical protein